MMAGQLCSRIGAWDNAAEFPSSVPTFAHYLRLAGYRTCLSGKMHFVGPDQLHGFEDRVTTDMYPGDFGWTPTWDEPKKIHWWFHNMLSVTEAGPYDRSLEMEHDDEVAYTTQRWLHDACARQRRAAVHDVRLVHAAARSLSRPARGLRTLSRGRDRPARRCPTSRRRSASRRQAHVRSLRPRRISRDRARMCARPGAATTP